MRGLGLASVAGALAMMFGTSDADKPAPAPPTGELHACRATDGDTIRCGSERIRLLAIDAPEMPGHCRRGRMCAPGDPYAAKAALERDLRQGRITTERIRIGAWGRTDAIVRVNGINLSCR